MVPEKANEQHYEVPAEFFQFVLGRRRKYSCCYWPDESTTLDEAEDASLEVTCERAEIEDGMRVLDLGCGWGSLSLWIAEHFPSCSVTAVSNSQSQRRFIEDRAKQVGVDERLTVITADMNEFHPHGEFDRVVSIEMFEHMRNHEELLRRISGWLTSNGALFVHIFCHRNVLYEFVDNGVADWMSRYFFSGGIMPSASLLPSYDRDMHVVDSWQWNGEHYRKTADAWIDRMERNRDSIIPILGDIYGVHSARIWFQRWRMLFLAGSELFGYDNGNQWYVTHYRFERTMNSVTRDLTRRQTVTSKSQ